MSSKVGKIFNFIAFIALAIIGIALLLAFAFKGNNLSNPMRLIAEILAYIVVIFYAFVYAYRNGSDTKGKWTKAQIIKICIWLVATILVVVFVILNA